MYLSTTAWVSAHASFHSRSLVTRPHRKLRPRSDIRRSTPSIARSKEARNFSASSLEEWGSRVSADSANRKSVDVSRNLGKETVSFTCQRPQSTRILLYLKDTRSRKHHFNSPASSKAASNLPSPHFPAQVPSSSLDAPQTFSSPLSASAQKSA